MPTLAFKSRVGLVPPFFVPADSDVAPAATLSGPTGEHVLVVSDGGVHPEFGARWRVDLPEPFWLEGEYVVSAGEHEYVITVEPHSGTITPDEARRLARLAPAEHVAAVSAFVPQER